jgi:hypothetical protein
MPVGTKQQIARAGIGGVAILACTCAHADWREPALIQAMSIGLVMALVAPRLVVVFVLDHPLRIGAAASRRSRWSARS